MSAIANPPPAAVGSGSIKFSLSLRKVPAGWDDKADQTALVSPTSQSGPTSLEQAVASPRQGVEGDGELSVLPIQMPPGAPYRVQITNLESGVVNDYRPRPGTEQ
jgi:hypothetical protein